MMPAASLSEGAVVSSGVLEVLWVVDYPPSLRHSASIDLILQT